jgi:tetratricopeptide (TPR) repeat protein
MDTYDRLALGKLYLEAKWYPEALDQFRQGKEKEPELKDSEWYALEARAYTGLGDLDRAIQACKTGMAESYSDNGLQLDAGPIHVELAEIAVLQDQFATAALECRAAIQKGYEDETEVEDSIVIYRPGWWLSTEARLANAARCFDFVAEAGSNVHLGRGYLYLAMSRYADAEEQFRQAAALNNSPEAFWLWGISALSSKRRDIAIRIFGDMVQEFPQDERGLVGLALVHAAQASNPVAFDYCNKALSINPHGGELHAVLTYLCWSQGNYSEAVSEAQKASRAGFSIHYLLVRPPDEHGKDHRFLTLGEDGNAPQTLFGAHENLPGSAWLK